MSEAAIKAELEAEKAKAEKQAAAKDKRLAAEQKSREDEVKLKQEEKSRVLKKESDRRKYHLELRSQFKKGQITEQELTDKLLAFDAEPMRQEQAVSAPAVKEPAKKVYEAKKTEEVSED